MKIFRWIVVFPGAIIGGIVISFIAKYITEFWQDDWGIAWLHSVYFYFTYALMSMVMPVGYTIIGMEIAPSYKRETGIFLISAMIIYTLVLILLSVYLVSNDFKYTLNAKGIVYFVFQFLGCVISFFYLPEREVIYVDKPHEEDINPATNLNIEILELTDKQYSAMELMYGNEISREDALKKVNSIRAFKR